MLLWLGSVALAGNLYINGTYVDPKSVAGVNLEKVTVRFDDQGNILVDAPGYKIEVVDPPSTPSASTAPGPAPTVGAVAGPVVTAAKYWLVTDDGGSGGHTVAVSINGQSILTVKSGDPQKILDVGRWLKPGANQITVHSESANASGGSFYVFIGTGSDQSGTVVMDDPTVQFGVGSTRAGPYERQYTLDAR